MIDDICIFVKSYDIENKTNIEAYEMYLKFCAENSIKPYSKIGFGQRITKLSKYKLIDKTFKNHKYRIFIKSTSSQD